MTVGQLRDLVRHVPVLSADDSVGQAIRIMRMREAPALLVSENGRLVGMVHEEDLAELALSVRDGLASAGLRATPARQVMRPISYVFTETTPLLTVAEHLRSTGEAAVGVVDQNGGYLGILLRRDLVAALAGEPFVPPIAGLATPFGVHMTTGSLRAGPGNLALVATGLALMVINVLASRIIYGIGLLLEHFFPQPPGPAPALSPGWDMAITGFIYAVQISIFAALFRFSPLSRVHAAEHMVIHAIEAGEDLTLEKVRPMERVHARCGTNLVALLVLLLIAFQFLTSMKAAEEMVQLVAMLVLMLIVLFGWRRLGAGLQRWVTTRRPSDRQLAQAIRVGERMLAEIRAHPGARTAGLRRVWNLGLVQVVGGYLLAQGAVDYGWPLVAKVWAHIV